jgi:hypothetical protein
VATTFCVPSVQDRTVDLLYGLPGPAALLLPVRLEISGP